MRCMGRGAVMKVDLAGRPKTGLPFTAPLVHPVPQHLWLFPEHLDKVDAKVNAQSA